MSMKHSILFGAIVVASSAAVARIATRPSVPSPMAPPTVALPSQLFYSGFVTDGSGAPLADGQYSIKVELFDAATAGNSLCPDPPPATATLAQGHFRVAITDACTKALAIQMSTTFVEVTVSNGSMSTVIPPAATARPAIGAVPFALAAPASGVIGTDPTTGTSTDMQTAMNDVFTATQIPTGTITAFAGDANDSPPGGIPSGWALCDGSVQSTTNPKFVKLFAVIGTKWGNGGGAGMFSLPDLRGTFVRGVDGPVTGVAAAGNDQDAAARTAIKTGGNTGDAVGSFQVSAVQNHSHVGITGPAGPPNNCPVLSQNCATNNTAPATGGVTGGATNSATETRPTNAYVNYLIKL
jgi:microcystin-dependent protein